MIILVPDLMTQNKSLHIFTLSRDRLIENKYPEDSLNVANKCLFHRQKLSREMGNFNLTAEQVFFQNQSVEISLISLFSYSNHNRS